MNFQINLKDKKISSQIDKLTDMQLDAMARIIHADISAKTPQRTSRLIKDIKWKRDNRNRIVYILGKRSNEVAEYLVYGTKPHLIKPRRKKALAWVDMGTMKLIVRKKSFVKGIKAGKYFKWEISDDTKNKLKILAEKLIRMNGAIENVHLLDRG
jgi:hypothetical protein